MSEFEEMFFVSFSRIFFLWFNRRFEDSVRIPNKWWVFSYLFSNLFILGLIKSRTCKALLC